MHLIIIDKLSSFFYCNRSDQGYLEKKMVRELLVMLEGKYKSMDWMYWFMVCTGPDNAADTVRVCMRSIRHVRTKSITIKYLVSVDYTVELVGSFQQFRSESGRDKLGVHTQLFHHVGNGCSAKRMKM